MAWSALSRLLCMIVIYCGGDLMAALRKSIEPSLTSSIYRSWRYITIVVPIHGSLWSRRNLQVSLLGLVLS